jgi:large subunit ribosomal protein L35
MPKLKTNKSAAKRLKRTGSGKLMRNRMGRRHILTGKSSKRKRHMRKQTMVAPGMVPRMNVLVPYLDN